MSDNNSDGVVMPFSEAAWNRSVTIGAEPKPSIAPSASHVEANGPQRIEGTDLAPHRAGVFASLRDKTGEVITSYRDPVETDVIDVTLPSGQPTSMTVRQAMFAGIIGKDASGKLFEVDQIAQNQIKAEIAKVEQSKKDAESLKFTNEVEAGIASIAQSMGEAGVPFENEFAQFLGADGEASSISQPANQWAQANGVDLHQQMQRLTSHLRDSVIAEVCLPRGIDPATFQEYLASPMVRARGNKAALYALHGRSLAGFHALADEALGVGIRFKNKR